MTNLSSTSTPPSGAVVEKQSDSSNAIDSTLPMGLHGIRSSSANLLVDGVPSNARPSTNSDSAIWHSHQSAIVGHQPVQGATRLLTSPQEAGMILSPLASTSTTIGSLMPTHASSSPSIVPAPSSTLSSGINTPTMPSLTIASFSSLTSPVNTLKIGEPSSLTLAQPNEGTSIPPIFGRQQPSSSGLRLESCNIPPSSPSPSGSMNSLTSVASSTQNTNLSMNSGPCHHVRSTSPTHSQVGNTSIFNIPIDLPIL